MIDIYNRLWSITLTPKTAVKNICIKPYLNSYLLNLNLKNQLY